MEKWWEKTSHTRSHRGKGHDKKAMKENNVTMSRSVIEIDGESQSQSDIRVQNCVDLVTPRSDTKESPTEDSTREPQIAQRRTGRIETDWASTSAEDQLISIKPQKCARTYRSRRTAQVPSKRKIHLVRRGTRLTSNRKNKSANSSASGADNEKEQVGGSSSDISIDWGEGSDATGIADDADKSNDHNATVRCPKEQAEQLFANLKRLVRTKSDSGRVLELLRALTPQAVGDDVMLALMFHTRAKSYCQTRLVGSEDAAVARRSTNLLARWNKWVVGGRWDDTTVPTGTQDGDVHSSPFRPPLLASSAAASHEAKLSECVDLASDNDDSDNDCRIISTLTPTHTPTETSTANAPARRRSRRINARKKRKKRKFSREFVISDSEGSAKRSRFLSSEGAKKVVLKYCAAESANQGVASSMITLTAGDVYRLRDGEFLNDSVIAFYLSYLHKEIFDDQQRIEILMFSPFYFQILSRDGAKKVHQWLGGRNIFECTLLVVPIVKKCHWSLAMVCNPGKLLAGAEAVAAVSPSEGDLQEEAHAAAAATTQTALGKDGNNHEGHALQHGSASGEERDTLSILVPSVAGSGDGEEKESDDSVSSDGLLYGHKGGDDAEDVSATPAADGETMMAAASESSSKDPTKSKHGAVTGGEHDLGGFPLHLFDPDNGFESKQLVGRQISVHWPRMNDDAEKINFYWNGQLIGYDPNDKVYSIEFDDGTLDHTFNLVENAFRLPPCEALYDGKRTPAGWTWDEHYPPGEPIGKKQTSVVPSPPPSPSVEPSQERSPAVQNAVTKSARSRNKPKGGTSEQAICLTDVSDTDSDTEDSVEHDDGQIPETARPCVLVLDSLGCHDARLARETLAGMLQAEAGLCHRALIGDLHGKSGQQFLPLIKPKIPPQRNGYDCGVFLLKYLQTIIQNVTTNPRIAFPDATFRAFFRRESFKRFKKKHILEMREHIKQVIEHIKDNDRKRNKMGTDSDFVNIN